MSKTEYIPFDSETGELFTNPQDALRHQEQRKTEREKEQSAKRNPKFIQLGLETGPETIERIARQSGVAVRILMFFFKNVDSDNAIIASQQLIGEQLGVSSRTVARAVKILVDNGAIGVAKSSNANIYILNDKIAWQRDYKARNFYKMNTTALLSESENQELFKKFDDARKMSMENSLKMKNKGSASIVKKQAYEHFENDSDIDNIPDDELPD